MRVNRICSQENDKRDQLDRMMNKFKVRGHHPCILEKAKFEAENMSPKVTMERGVPFIQSYSTFSERSNVISQILASYIRG
ncbi:hypothetical protein GDO86_002657 [Hymenochirus boettgeri]|uniref:Uncharacterized protein n=1 Tax=Hymenochirus boettgeri TaxID=247094 RepID=A0A8T2K0H9_9PIPI|nr:hypothetical protein GDO86_002657 [Hymenochirus boettgeri]